MRRANILNRMPPYLKELKEFQEISRVMNPFLDDLRFAIDRLIINNYLNEMDEGACSRWESILNLKVYNTDTLDDRRFRIISKHTTLIPYTERRLKEMINTLVGIENYILDIDTKKMHVNCKINLGVKKQMNVVKKLLDGVIPLNMTINVELLYNTHETLSRYTHKQLSNYNHEQLREDVFK